MNKLGVFIVVFLLVEAVIGPPVDPKKEKKTEEKDGKNEKAEEMDELGLEYGRYLQQVVQALEEDKEFAKKLENVSAEQIRSGHIAHELEFVKHNVRSKLDELKRIEVDRLRKLIQQQMERVELGLYRDEDGHLLNSPDGRRWRTIQNHRRAIEGLDRKGVKIPKHLDIENPHSFEIEDLRKLIQTATSDLEELDRKRREEFKKYELEKEAKYRESLKNMTEEERKKAEKHHEEVLQKHKETQAQAKVHHPGSKPQLEEVWEEQDHLPKDEFNPRTFFAMHDINGDGHLDEQEVEALLIPEIKKMYNPENGEDDPNVMEEEFHRMREHIFNETDKNKDSLISLEEFLKMTEAQEFQRDEGWKGIDEQQIYSEAELEEYMRHRQMEMQQHYQQYPYADQRQYYDVGNAQQGLPPHINYQVPPGGMPPQPGYPQQHPPQYGGNMHGQYPGEHPQQQQMQGHPPQQYQGGHVPQQPMQGVPPQQYQGGHVPQQPMQGVPPQQYQGGHVPQQPMQGVPPQQYQGGHVPQQPMQGVPPQQYQGGHVPQQHQAVPQQQYQAGSLQQQPQGQLQGGQQQFQGVPQQQQQQHQAGTNNQPQAPQLAQHQQPPVSGQKQDMPNSINQIPNAEPKLNVPQEPSLHASSQQAPKTQT